MTITLLVVTHLGAFLLGALTFRALVLRQAPPADHPKDDPVKLRRPPTVAVAILVACLFVITLGVQQQGYQRERDERDACVAAWGNDFTDALDTRVRAANKATKAETTLYRAARDLLGVLSRRVADPPEAGNGDLLRARLAYDDAGAQVGAANEQVDDVRARNPYPTLDCQ